MYSFKKLFKVASTSEIKPVLQMLYVKNNKVYATDSFKAIIMNADFGGREGFITPLSASIGHENSKVFKKLVLPELEERDLDFPSIEQVIPEDDFTISLNRKGLVDLLEAMQSGDKFDRIELVVPKDRMKPLIFKNGNGVGIFMPMIK